jgi:chromosome partitioning protein
VAETTSSPSPSRPRSSSQAESASAPSEGTAKARIIAIANQKGGVGKSTTAVSLGAALAEDGHRVLVLDLDPQGNASTGMGIRHETRDVTVYDVLATEAGIDDAIVETPVPGLDAVPSTIDLAGAEIELVSQFSREMRLRRALDPIREGRYEFILMDCPPSLGLLTVNALAAAEELIVPIQCEYYALEGLGQLLRNVKLVQQNVNPGLRLTGIVLTMFDPRTKLAEQVVEEVRKYFGDRVYESVIPRTVRLSEAPGFGQPITVYDPKSRGAERYRALAKEVAARLPSSEPIPVIDDMPVMVPAVQDAPSPAPTESPVPQPAPTQPAEPGPQDEASRVYEFDLSGPNGAPTDPPPTPPPVVATSPEPAASSPDVPPLGEPVPPATTGDDGRRERRSTDDETHVPGPQESPTQPDDADRALIAQLEAPAPAEFFDQEAADEPKKRRWSLFKKGGDR